MADNAAQKKPGFIQRVSRFFKDIKGEMKKVVWPDKKQIVNNATIVVGVMTIAAIFVSCFDFVASFLVRSFAGLL